MHAGEPGHQGAAKSVMENLSGEEEGRAAQKQKLPGCVLHSPMGLELENQVKGKIIRNFKMVTAEWAPSEYRTLYSYTGCVPVKLALP